MRDLFNSTYGLLTDHWKEMASCPRFILEKNGKTKTMMVGKRGASGVSGDQTEHDETALRHI